MHLHGSADQQRAKMYKYVSSNTKDISESLSEEEIVIMSITRLSDGLQVLTTHY